MQLLDNVLAGLHSALSLGHTVQLCCVAGDSTAVYVHLLHLLPSPEAYGAHLIAVFLLTPQINLVAVCEASCTVLLAGT